MPDGMVRLADKQPQDGERVRVMLANGSGPFRATYREGGTEPAFWEHRHNMWLAKPDDRWEPIGASDE